MTQWSQEPKWNALSDINEGEKYAPADGVTADDMNKIIENMTYLYKYGGRVIVFSTGAVVVGTTLKLSSKEV